MERELKAGDQQRSKHRHLPVESVGRFTPGVAGPRCVIAFDLSSQGRSADNKACREGRCRRSIRRVL
jgi:hypothetical protein